MNVTKTHVSPTNLLHVTFWTVCCENRTRLRSGASLPPRPVPGDAQVDLPFDAKQFHGPRGELLLVLCLGEDAFSVAAESI